MDRQNKRRSNSFWSSSCALALVLLAGCGGGGGGGAPQSGSAGARGGIGVIAAADVLGLADANIPFAQQYGYNAQVIGQFPDAKEIPETGINYTALPNGETLRLGKVADPLNPNSKVFAFQLAPGDPTTSGSKR